MFAEVVVDIAHSNLNRAFTYAVPSAFAVCVGMRVLVPFGKQQVVGIVVKVLTHCTIETSKIKTLIKPMESYPAILPALITLAEQMAKESHATIAQTLRLMIPAEMRRGKIKVKQEDYFKLTETAKPSLEQSIVHFGEKTKKGILLRLLSDGQARSKKELAECVHSPNASLKTLVEDGLLATFKQEVFRLPYGEDSVSTVQDYALMPQQAQAIKTIQEETEQGKNCFLIHGVTGSGKTEVYIHLVKKALKQGKGVIILVPEISLTPQMVRWFRERFANNAAVLHSRLSAGEKFDEWRRIRQGQARVVIGARSAIFAPVENLGLIVVDEEHETTYLSDRHPQYDARHVARLRAKNEGGIVVLSSATPSIKSFAQALYSDVTLIEMPKRVMNRPLPIVHTVDMRRELQSGNASMFSVLLLEKMKQHLSMGNQIILFLNRRGHSTFVSCRNCGHVIHCDACDVSMTYHMQSRYEKEGLKCHLCGNTKPVPKFCPQCESPYIRFFGGGTQKVEEEFKKHFPNVATLRMDLDTTNTKNAHAEILESFAQQKAQVLIGTQMITKGLDFPNVTLVGVIAADITLFLPDYRAPERTFQLLTQVAGRAGRATRAGEVVVQTYKPDHPVIIDAATQDYRAFFTKELERRKKAFYPPYTQIVRLLVESKKQQSAQDVCSALFTQIKAHLSTHPNQKKKLIALHSDEAPVKRIHNKFRYQILLKMFVHEDCEHFKAFLETQSHQSLSDVDIIYEVDPINMM